MAYRLPAAVRALAKNVPTVAPVPHRTVLSLGGSQAVEFLNGVLAARVQHQLPFYSALLNAQGRVLFDLFLYTRLHPETNKPEFLLEHDSRNAETSLSDLLKRFILRSKVKVRDVSEEYDVWQSWGAPRPEPGLSSPAQTTTTNDVESWTYTRAASGAAEPSYPESFHWPWGTIHEQILDRRAPGMGTRLLVRKGEQPSILQQGDYQVNDSSAYTLHRIIHGVPEGFTDIPNATAFPMDSNMDIMGGVDFRKGCYVGQELTVRTYHTGMVRKRILPVFIGDPNVPHDASLKLPPGLDIKPHIRPDIERAIRPRGSSKLLSNVGGVGLALMRLEHAEGFERGELVLKVEDGSAGSKQVQCWRPEWFPPPQ